MSKEAMTLALEALECTEYPQDHYDAITALREALAEQPAQQTCNCRWEDGVQVQQCTLHEAHVDAIHEWAERAKEAEAKLKEQPDYKALYEKSAQQYNELAALMADKPAQQEPVAMRMPKVGDEVICIEDESLGMVAYLTAGGSPEIRFDDGSHGTYVLREFAELFRYTTPQPAQQEIDWKDQYEKQKRRADMWVAKYEADIGPLEKAGPVTAQQEPVAVVSGYYGGQCVILPIDPARIYNSNTFLYTSPQPCPTCEALARTVMLDQTSHDAQRKPLTITEESAWDLARYVYARSNPHESPQILLSAMEIKQIIEAAYGIKEKNT